MTDSKKLFEQFQELGKSVKTEAVSAHADKSQHIKEFMSRLEDDLIRGVFVGLAKNMEALGIDLRTPEGKEQLKEIIPLIHDELMLMARRFNAKTRDEMRKFKRMGIERYERFARRWIIGKTTDDEGNE